MLTGIILKLLGFLGSDIVTNVVSRVADYFQKKASDDLARFQTGVSADTQIALAHVEDELEARKQQTQILAADRGWWDKREAAWIRPLLVYPCVLHFGAILFDSTFPLGWGIAKLPAPYDAYEQAIILSFFIARPFEKIARVFIARR